MSVAEVSELDIRQVGGSLAEAIPSGDDQAVLQHHPSSSGSVTFHGQGGGNARAKHELLRADEQHNKWHIQR